MRYLLDTDHLSVLQHQPSPAYGRLTARLAQHPPADFALSVVSLHEQVNGFQAYISRAKNTAELVHRYGLLVVILTDFARSTVVPFDAAAGTGFDHLQALRLGVPTMDLRIAATALSRGLVLLTRNTRDFSKVPGLTTEDWTA